MLSFVLTVFVAMATVWGHQDPEMYLETPEMIRFWGYEAEEHWVTTQDGFILGLHRIVGKKTTGSRPKFPESRKRVVFLQHGLVDSSATWVMNNPEESFGFMLSDAGYDVWLGNVRGNTYSTNHTTLKPRQAAFWDWSFDEMAAYDLPAMINYVIRETGVESLSYFGHSQGTEMAFLGFSQNHELAKKVNFFGALAPVARITHVEGFFKALDYFEPELQKLFEILGVHDFAPSNWFIKALAALVCPIDDALICKDIIFLMCGWDTSNLNTTRTGVYVAHTPAGTSVKNIIHWAQMIKAKRIQKYDYGSGSANLHHYNQTVPPEYDISSLDIPVGLVAGGNDFLGDPRDVAWLEGALKPGVIVDNIFFDDYNHLDFVWGLDAHSRFYHRLIQILGAL